MSGARRGPNQLVSIFESEIVSVGTTIELGGLDLSKPHCFAGVKFFADALGAIPAVPAKGSVTLQIQTLNNAPRYEDPPATTIQAAAPSTLTWAANTVQVKATPSGIDVATHYRLVVTCNET